jgi:hypothetical protein
LERTGYMVDVFSATQTAARDPTWTDELMAKFGTRLRSDRRIKDPERPGGKLGQATTLAAAADAVYCYADEFNVPYELVVVIRHDMQFKHDGVAETTYSKKEKFTAPFKMIKDFRPVPWRFSRVPDTMQTMPWRLFPYIRKHGIFGIHEAWPADQLWKVMVSALPNGGAEMDFLYPHEYADSDPQKVSNSLCKFSQRGEGVRCDQAAEAAADLMRMGVCLERAREKYCAEVHDDVGLCHG